jgi:hypothetical protein
MLHKEFDDTGHLPNVVFYDNNCRLHKHLVKQQDGLYKLVGLPVDV